jgi:glycosyltransferase involved in cell wall biosynthesis
MEQVEWLGRVPNEQVYDVVGEAACLIFPSTGYESLPKTLIEAMAVGTPVIGADIGSLTEVVTEGKTGALFTVGDSMSLSEAVRKFFASASAERLSKMRQACREKFVECYTSDANYNQLIKIYREAIRRRAQSGVPTPEDGGGVENFNLAD